MQRYTIAEKILLASALFTAGCAETIGDIDRTQPDLIDKAHFQGQWFVRETVVNVPPTSPAAFIGDMGGLEVVVWDIQKEWLVGYRAYEQIPGAESQVVSELSRPGFTQVAPGLGKGRDPDTYRGNPVVAYRIESHVDVQRTYNSRTGEQSNVIVENMSDRPWQERAFMRIDWSQNDVQSFAVEARAFWPMFGADSTMSAFIPRSEGGPGAFRLELDEQGRARYIDFTVRRTVVPSALGCAALLFDSEIGDCTGEEIETRTSLLRVDPEREQEFVPLRYDDQQQGEFGLFRVIRPTYDERLGGTLSGRIQYAQIHDLWQHARDASGEPLPPSARTIRPVTFTLSEHFPDELLGVARQMAEEYDRTLQDLVAASRGQSPSDLRADLLADTGAECLFCLDENLDLHARNGDLRYNFLYWVHDRQAISPFGYGPPSAHPETGRIVSASAYVYGAEIDRYAEYARQIVDLMNGQIDEAGVFDGSYYRAARRRAGIAAREAGPALQLDTLAADTGVRPLLGDLAFKRLETLRTRGAAAFPVDTPELDRQRIAALAGKPLAARMLPEEWSGLTATGSRSFFERRAAAEQRRREALADPAAASPADPRDVTQWFGPGALDQLNALSELAARNNLWLASFSDPAILGLAEELAREGLDEAALYQRLREDIFRAVALHELGHTLGLRHNFAGSADPLNYPDEYWRLRIQSIQPLDPFVNTALPSATALLHSNCSLPGPLFDTSGNEIPGTNTEAACAVQRSARMQELQYASIMDYEGRFNSHFHGLGYYDRAALAAGYADLVEVFDETARAGLEEGSSRFGVNLPAAILDANQIRNPALGEGLDLALVRQGGGAAPLSHYVNFPALFGGHENLAHRSWLPRAEYLAQLRAARAGDNPPLKVPYQGCYDEYVDAVENCHRWDQGADHYEIVANLLSGYEQYYPFNNFQRDRTGFDSFKVLSRTASRYFLPLSNMYQHWLWGAAVTGYNDDRLPRGLLAAAATEQGFNLLADTLSTPRNGPHLYDVASHQYRPASEPCPEASGEVLAPVLGGVGYAPWPRCITLPRGDGRSYFSRFDTSSYDGFERTLEVGHFYDQMAALLALTNSSAQIVGVASDVAADSRRFRIPYNLVFEDRLSLLYGAIYAGNDAVYARRVQPQPDGSVLLVPRDALFPALAPELAAGLPAIAPGRSKTAQVQALVAGLLMLDGSLTAGFAHRGQISLAGSGEEREAPAGFEAVEATDPRSGRSFVAYRGSESGSGSWYAAELLERARQLVADPESSTADIESIFGDIELLRVAAATFSD